MTKEKFEFLKRNRGPNYRSPHSRYRFLLIKGSLPVETRVVTGKIAVLEDSEWGIVEGKLLTRDRVRDPSHKTEFFLTPWYVPERTLRRRSRTEGGSPGASQAITDRNSTLDQIESALEDKWGVVAPYETPEERSLQSQVKLARLKCADCGSAYGIGSIGGGEASRAFFNPFYWHFGERQFRCIECNGIATEL